MNRKVAVYTCITGGYDEPKPSLSCVAGVDYFLFTDTYSSKSIKKSDIWNVVVLDEPEHSSKDLARYVKMHPHQYLPEYEMTVWVDGNMQIVGDLQELIEKVERSQHEIFIYPHPERNCIYQEAAKCIHHAHDWVWNTTSQMRSYASEGHPPNDGLFETGVVFRKNSPSMALWMEQWWNEYQNGTKRDQLSLTVVARRNQQYIQPLGPAFCGVRDQYFQLHSHVKKKKKPIQRFRKYINKLAMFFIPYRLLFSIK